MAEQRGCLVGLLVLESAEDNLLLDNVAVDPNVQGLNEVRLYTNAAMTENLSYYPRHGYRETHRVTQDGYQRVFFTKLLCV